MINKFKTLKKSFNYAFSGLFRCIKYERNMRIHIVTAAFMIYFSSFYDLSKTEFITLLFSISLVIICEMINTAIEETVDLVEKKYNLNAKIAKDIAAGAVLISAFFAVAVGIVLFFDISILLDIVDYFLSSIIRLFLFILLFSASIIFIFSNKNKNENRGLNGDKDSFYSDYR